MEISNNLAIEPMKRSTEVPEAGSNQGNHRLSMVIPAYNEEDTIRQAISEAATALGGMLAEYEILIVDDGSADRTAEIVLEESVTNPCVRLIKQPRNMGYGAALRAGFQAARFELVSFTDADCQFELSDLEYMLPLADQFDIVSGYRIDRKDPARRRFFSWGYNTLIQLLIGTGIRDIDCALKIYHRDTLQQFLPEANNFFANTEMFCKARRQDLSVVDVGVRHRPRAAGESKVSLWDIPETLKTLLPFWWTQVVFSAEKPAASESNRHFWLAFMLLVVVAGTLLLPNLSYPLIEPDEGRYAEIPREMIARGDWIVPTLRFKPYLDKPPLFYWLCAVSYKLFGPTDQAARLVPAASAFLTVLLTFVFGARMLNTRSAFLGALIMCLSLGFVICGRFLILDSLLALVVTLSLFLAYEAVASGRFRWSWWIASAVACGLGFLTKGPVALLLLAPPVVVYCWLSRLKSRPGFGAWLVYLLTACAVAAPWYVAVSLREPGFVHHFFWVHNFGRFLYSVNHPQPFWFYVPVLLLAWMPWGLLLVPLAVYLLKRSKELRATRFLGLGFLALWAVWCVMFFSVSKGKLPTYILPAWPAIALALGHFLATMGALSPRWLPEWNFLHSRFQNGLLALCFVSVVACSVTYLLRLDEPFEASYESILWIAALVGAWVLRKRWSPQHLFGVFALTAFVMVFQTTQDWFPAWGQVHTVLPASSPLREQMMHSPAEVICCGKTWDSVPFYLQRNDITYMPNHDLDQLAEHIDRQQGAYLFLENDVEAEKRYRIGFENSAVQTLWKTPKVTIIYLQQRKASPAVAALETATDGRQGAPLRTAEADSRATAIVAGAVDREFYQPVGGLPFLPPDQGEAVYPATGALWFVPRQAGN
ncbi:Undecaprenyl phosphate-alpha-4-amino-4-deoxy-L-arabinose arabinosyl transferase [Gimesia panareensis]|uniref:Undecaprenyl phosphate-alpha-4-amino-4-deoxy-L-arabinose arabinosyl transferase n=1 Tax=Gimesia panareensis TaxID=2527978 RepID=A0A517Q7G1_9PLAN|nr:glycosyltransferase [Gimesia panareensis]QDT27570.1 Undecaprenyl phosphate-alpha-4-amino-4-deoxy-L-arabinose arabinosyl transferase [Gimesia panareensis]